MQFLLTWELIPMSARGVAIDPGMDEASWAPRMLLSFFLPFLAGRPGYSGGWWGDYLDLSEFWVGTAYVGLLPMLLLPALMTRPWRHFADGHSRDAARFRVVFLIGITVIGLLLAFGRNTPLYGLLYRYVPGFDRLRWPAKFLQFVAFSLPLLGAYGLQGLLDHALRRDARQTGDSGHAAGRHPETTNTLNAPAWGILHFRNIVCCWAAVLVFLVAAASLVTWNINLFSWLGGRGFNAARQSPETLRLVKQDMWMSAGFAVLGVVVLAPFLFERVSQRLRAIAGCCIIATLFTNLFLVSRQFQPTAPDGIYNLRPEALPALTEGAEPGRFAQDGPFADGPQWLYGNSNPAVFEFAMNASYGETWLPRRVERIWGGDVLVPAEYSHLLWRMGRQPRTAFHRQRYMDLLNVRYFISGPGGKPEILRGQNLDKLGVETRPHPLPRALVVTGWSTVTDRKEAEKLLLSPGQDPYRTVVLGKTAEGVPEAMSAGPVDPAKPITSLAEAGVAEVRYGWNRVDMVAQAKVPSMLLLNDIFYPGWRAYVDGQPATILPANLFFRAVPLGPGEHRVAFVYRPTHLTAGLWGMVVSAAVLLALAMLLRRGRQGSSHI